MEAGRTLSLPGLTVHALCDGAHVFDVSVFAEVAAPVRAARLKAAGLEAIETEFAAYLLVFDSGAHWLVDTGCGALYGDTAGRLAGELGARGVVPEQISRIVMTHLHGDHCGGAVAEGRAVYPKAELCMHAAEFAHWQGTTGPASEVLDAYRGRISCVQDGDALAPGITAWHLPGHTPGHMGLRLEGGAALVGDILHSFALQLPDPDVNSIYDSDPAEARQTRRAALAHLAAQGVVWSGSHGIGPISFWRLTRAGQGYEAQPA